MQDEKIVTNLRVKSCVIKSFAYDVDRIGEVVEVKAEGLWASTEQLQPSTTDLPISLHITVYPGCGAIPWIGDNIQITIERL